ncbi:MAG TPA: transglycosylase family protein [Acidimicrobiales bacterium]|nr:transglycosylase family protein [Acidimicrobiales bacterium]
MRIRIALATVAAVITVIPVLLLTFLNGSPAASARVTRHEAVAQHTNSQPKVQKINSALMSYAQAEQVAKLADYYTAVTLAEEKSYLKEVAFYDTLEKQTFYKAILQQQAAAAARAQAAAAARAAAVAPAAVPVAAPAPPSGTGGGSDASSTNTPDWACIRAHESGDNYSEGGGGAYQFELSTWQGLTGLPSPAQDYPPSVQDSAALALYAQRGWEPWTTRFVCGL